jgi:hypothetical protein
MDMTSHIDMAPSARRRRGPKKRGEERRQHHVSFTVNTAELASMASHAEAAGVSVSAFIRTAVEAASGPGAIAPDRRRRRRSAADVGPFVAQLARLGNDLNQLLREGRSGHFPASTVAAIEEAAQAVSTYFYGLADRHDSED